MIINYPYYNSYYYNSISGYLKKEFGQKIVKISVDGGFTCPNRDGTLGTGGCIFCSEKGSGDFTSSRLQSITSQISSQILLIKAKWPNAKYIVYFQNFTNTYSDVESLREKYYEALSYPDVFGLAIATRPDCISDEVFNLLSEINDKTFLWIELGLQTIHKRTSDLINRCYDMDLYEKCLNKLNTFRIRTVIHLIIGLPGESKSEVMETAKYISRQSIFGIKLQLLHIIKGTSLEDYYKSNPSGFYFLEIDDYINIIADIIEILPDKFTIHRITGDGPKDLLISPMWSKNKFNVMNKINSEFRKRKSYQGKNYFSCSNLPSL